MPAPEDLPTAMFGGGDDYLRLMRECWAQDPADRPTFAAIISRLRRMLATEASLRRESPTKIPRGLSSLSTGAGGSVGGGLGGGLGGDETPVSRSRLTSLTGGGSDACLSPERRSTLGEESDSDTMGLSASPSMLSGLGGAGASPPKRRPSSVNGGAAVLRQLSSIIGGGTDDAEVAAAADAAAAAARQSDGGAPPAG